MTDEASPRPSSSVRASYGIGLRLFGLSTEVI